MNKYTYKDNKQGRKVIFECQSADILQADQQLKEALGIDAVKSHWISCTIEPVEAT